MQSKRLRELATISLCIFMALLMFILLKLKLTAVMLSVSLLLMLVTTINLKLGLTLLFITFPLSPIVSDSITSIPVLFNPAFFVGLILNMVTRKKSLKHNKRIFLFYLVILVHILLVSFYYQYYSS